MISWSNLGKGMIEWIFFMVKIIIFGLVLMILIVLWKFFFGFKHSEFNRVALTSSSHSDLVVTSFAQVDLLSLRNKDREILLPSVETSDATNEIVEREFSRAKAFCLHSYELVFGYNSLEKERQRLAVEGAAPVREPEIVAINTLRSENAPDSSTIWCQKKNEKRHRENLKKQLWYALEHDEILHTHVTHGQMALASLLDLARSTCRASGEGSKASDSCKVDALIEYWEAKSKNEGETLVSLTTKDIPDAKNALTKLSAPQQKNRAQQELIALTQKAKLLERSVIAHKEAANKGADLASLVLTFSSTLGVSQERKRYLGLWTSKRFYLQRDIAKVYYGTRFSPSSITSAWNIFTPDKIMLEFPKPNIIAIDRYSSFVVARNKIDKRASAKQSLANYLNQQIVTNLEQGIQRFHSRAVDAAEKIMMNRIPYYMDLIGKEYTITFKSPRRSMPDLSFLPGVLDLDVSDTEDDGGF